MSSRTVARFYFCVVVLFAVAGCVAPQANRPPEPAPTASPTPLPLPGLRARTVSIPDADPRPAVIRLLESSRFTLDLEDADIRSLLIGLGKQSPLNIIVDPEISGQVTADLDQVSLLQILDEVVVPMGFSYRVENNVLRVYRPERESRTWRIDYPNHTRTGTSDLSLSGFIGATVDIGQDSSSGSEDDSSALALSTTQTVDFWNEIETSLRAIVFGDSELATDPDQGEEGDADEPRRVVVARQSGLVVVTADSNTLMDVESYLRQVVEAQHRQVLIDAQIVEITLEDELNLGTDFEVAPGYGDSTSGVFARGITAGLREATITQAFAPVLTQGGISFGVARDDLGVVLQAIALQTDVRVVSTPRITTLNNHKALIKIVRNEVFFIAEVETEVVEGVGTTQTTEFVPTIVPVGVTLDVTPQVAADDEITLHIHPSFSEIVSVELQPTSDPSLPQVGSLPVIDLREVDTVLRVRNGGTVVLGGLVQSKEFEQERRVPYVGDIPIIGNFFKGQITEERRTELVIFLTPRVLDPPQITQIWEDIESRFSEIDDLRRERSLGNPWWRHPRGRALGIR
jgi:MSHA type pilus biogenesis protein MshL